LFTGIGNLSKQNGPEQIWIAAALRADLQMTLKLLCRQPSRMLELEGLESSFQGEKTCGEANRRQPERKTHLAYPDTQCWRRLARVGLGDMWLSNRPMASLVFGLLPPAISLRVAKNMKMSKIKGNRPAWPVIQVHAEAGLATKISLYHCLFIQQ
jgi:hypothetical protein